MINAITYCVEPHLQQAAFALPVALVKNKKPPINLIMISGLDRTGTAPPAKSYRHSPREGFPGDEKRWVISKI